MGVRGSNPWSTTMSRPINYWGSAGSGASRPCEACNEPIKVDKRSPAIYGGGRFCSPNCARLRNPDVHLKYLLDNPEEYQAWFERKKAREAAGPSMDYEVPL